MKDIVSLFCDQINVQIQTHKQRLYERKNISIFKEFSFGNGKFKHVWFASNIGKL